jgi:prepilin-type N-terminal cleavage/methylation domain-containing protein
MTKTIIRHKFHRGFTLVETLIAVAITAIIGTSLMVALNQMVKVSEFDKNRMTAIKQVENALHFMNRDVQMANTLTLDDASGNGFPLEIAWQTWDNKRCKAIYSIENGDLVRTYYVDDFNNPNLTQPVARSIDDSASLTKCQFVDNRFSLKLTATVGSYQPASVTRDLHVTPRSVQ